MKIYVIGIGLIGGSMVLDLKETLQDVEIIGNFKKARFDTLDFLKTLSTSEVPIEGEQFIIESRLGQNLEIMKDFYQKYPI